MTKRREFDTQTSGEIITRATDEASKRVHCERCGVWCKSRKDFQIDHIIAEGLRPDEDKKRKLTAADGQLLCLDCHRNDKTPDDVAKIAKAKRLEAAQIGATAKPRGQGLGRREKDPKPPVRVANGMSALARQGFVPASEVEGFETLGTAAAKVLDGVKRKVAAKKEAAE